jgi:hypothetical protein
VGSEGKINYGSIKIMGDIDLSTRVETRLPPRKIGQTDFICREA